MVNIFVVYVSAREEKKVNLFSVTVNMEYFLTFEVSFMHQETADLSVKLPNLIKTISETFSYYT